MKNVYVFLALLLMVTVVSVGQHRFDYENFFPADTATNKIPTQVVNVGLAVDWEGKVWVQSYLNVVPRDTIQQSGLSTYVDVRPIFVYNPNGTPASFSPIRILSGVDQNGASVTDTLIQRTGYGGNSSPFNGNIFMVWGTRTAAPGAMVWEINHKTGAGVRRIIGPPGLTTNSPASVGINNDGEVFLSGVLGALPVQILNPDFSAGTQVTAALPDIGRAMTVSGDGNDVFLPRFTSVPPKTYVYHSANGSLGPYTRQDSLFIGASIESIAINPADGKLWVIADRRSVRDSVGNYMWTANMAYGMDLGTKAIVDSFWIHVWPQTSTGPLPRGIAFSPTGDTVYVGHFDVATIPTVSRFIYGLFTKVSKIDNSVPDGYVLSQNYPNPFNPSTEIEFTVAREGMTTLRVYDMLGREVVTLVNEHMPVGTFKATFNAKDLTSGTYVYELVSGNTRLTKRMMLLK